MEFNGTFLATIVTFVLFVYLMNKVLYMPVREIVEKRTKFIDDNLLSASTNKKRVEEIAQDKASQIQMARTNAKNEYLDKVNGFKSQKNEILNLAKKDSKSELENAYHDLENISNDAKESLKGHMTELANDIVEKMIGYRSEVQNLDNDFVNKILYH